MSNVTSYKLRIIRIIQEYSQPKIGRKIRIFSLGRKNNILIKRKSVFISMLSWKDTTSKRLLKSLYSSFLELNLIIKREQKLCLESLLFKRKDALLRFLPGYQTGYFIVQHWVLVRKQSSLCSVRVFVELLQLHFNLTSAACLWSHFSCDIASLEQELNCCFTELLARTGCQRCLWPEALEAVSLSPRRVPYHPPMPPVPQRTFCSNLQFS